MHVQKEYGDITIGDFWGLGKEKPFTHDTKLGTSLVLINNEKGKKYFQEIKDKIFCEQRELKEAIQGNDQLRHPSEKHPKRNEFLELYLQNGLHYALDKLL